MTDLEHGATRRPTVGVVGVVGVGGAVAAALKQADRGDVVLCGRTAAPELRVERGGAAPVVLGPVLADPEQVDGADWVLLAVKAHQTAATAPWLERCVRPGTVVAVLQNGVEHRERVEPLTPGTEVLPAVFWFGAERSTPAGSGCTRRRA